MCFKIFGLHFQYVASMVYKYIVLQAAASCLKIRKKNPDKYFKLGIKLNYVLAFIYGISSLTYQF
jgi:hypothetical protein